MSSFWKLGSMRLYSNGPIPWDKIRDFGVYIGLDQDVLDPFISLIMTIDSEYLDHTKPADAS
jgi:hypothetical protein